MQPITYLCFTLLSILIQFCLMDFINERIQADDTFIEDKSTDAKNLSFLLRNIKEKPHALYYRKESGVIRKHNETQANYTNTSLPVTSFTTSTDFGSTLFDMFYDENTSITDSAITTEAYYNNSEYDNVTEITFFDKKKSNEPEIPKISNSLNNNCWCNLLFKKCDINCCCDNECSEVERSLFISCKKKQEECFDYNKKMQYFCLTHNTCNEDFNNNAFEDFFCIEKFNLADERKINEKELISKDMNNYFKWHEYPKKKVEHKFEKDMYMYNHPVWLLKGKTFDTISLPRTVTNNYCSGIKPIKFLKNEYIKCNVHIKDLHFLYALQFSNEGNVVSPKQGTINSTTLNCSTLHCINWTVIVCDQNCIPYNKDLHEPTCSEHLCRNIAVKVEYIFSCNNSVITNATLKMHVRQVPTNINYVAQEVIVSYYMGNDSAEDIVKYSGNPGYIRGLPIIASFLETNHTINFYNRTHVRRQSNILLPQNQNSECLLTNTTHNMVKFGYNTRIKCRLMLGKNYTVNNKTDGCLKVQMKIVELLQLNQRIFISPSGNPNNLSDNKWLSLQRLNRTSIIYGEYRSYKTKLICYNLMTRFAYIFAYADLGYAGEEVNKILSARVEGIVKNVTLILEDSSIILTLDTIFIDVSKPGVHEYSLSPHSNINLPKKIFLPSRSIACNNNIHYLNIILCTIIINFKQIK